mgnify:CR=1 FL=1
MFGMRKKTEMPAREKALPGRGFAIPTADIHHVFGTPLKGPFADGVETAMFGLGCFWGTGHNEVVLVVFDPDRVSYETLLKTFWEAHDPTQGMRQGNDVGTQYRSGVYTFSDAQQAAVLASKKVFGDGLAAAGFPAITTEVLPAPEFYYAEDYHQQYLSKIPNGYCGLGGTGVTCPVGTGVVA